jgi:hypothetical protein
VVFQNFAEEKATREMNCFDNRRAEMPAQPPFVTICEVTCPEMEMSFWVLRTAKALIPSVQD